MSRAEPGSLTRAHAAWVAADRDRNGRIGADEATVLATGPAAFRLADFDGDGAWSREEFLRFYREQRIAANEPVGRDLEAEVVRLQALRKLKRVEELRRLDPGATPYAPGRPHVRPPTAGTARLVQPTQGAVVGERPAAFVPTSTRLVDALAGLERKSAARSATRADVALLRDTIRERQAASVVRSSPSSGTPHRNIEASRELDAALARIDFAVARGLQPGNDLGRVRALLQQRGWLDRGPAQSRAENRLGSSNPSSTSPVREREIEKSP